MAGEKLHFPDTYRRVLEPFLPATQKTAVRGASGRGRPHVTLTYASSLDSMIASAPGTQTVLSGPQSKAMTHYLRSRHSGILVGAGTAVVDDPTLNTRLEGAGFDAQPQPIIVDRQRRWSPQSELKVIRAASAHQGKSPWIIWPSEFVKKTTESPGESQVVRYLSTPDGSMEWPSILALLHNENIDSVMIEGGASVIRDLLSHYSDLIDTVIITLAPTFLGEGGLRACPCVADGSTPIRLECVQWLTLGEDAIVCGQPKQSI